MTTRHPSAPKCSRSDRGVASQIADPPGTFVIPTDLFLAHPTNNSQGMEECVPKWIPTNFTSLQHLTGKMTTLNTDSPRFQNSNLSQRSRKTQILHLENFVEGRTVEWQYTTSASWMGGKSTLMTPVIRCGNGGVLSGKDDSATQLIVQVFWQMSTSLSVKDQIYLNFAFHCEATGLADDEISVYPKDPDKFARILRRLLLRHLLEIDARPQFPGHRKIGETSARLAVSATPPGSLQDLLRHPMVRGALVVFHKIEKQKILRITRRSFKMRQCADRMRRQVNDLATFRGVWRTKPLGTQRIQSGIETNVRRSSWKICGGN